MSSFKDSISQDINIVFSNTDEFSEYAEINDQVIIITEDNDKLKFRISKDTSGLITGDILFFISISEYEKIPKVKHPPRVGDALLYKNKPATITDYSEDCGLYEIILQFSGVR